MAFCRLLAPRFLLAFALSGREASLRARQCMLVYLYLSCVLGGACAPWQEPNGVATPPVRMDKHLRLESLLPDSAKAS